MTKLAGQAHFKGTFPNSRSSCRECFGKEAGRAGRSVGVRRGWLKKQKRSKSEPSTPFFLIWVKKADCRATRGA